MSTPQQRGFTLIELMITVAVIAILAAVAYPSYTEQVARSRRADAKAVILEGSQFMERYYTENNSYTGATLPTALQRSPKEGSQFYTISLTNQADDSYTVQAVPQGAMTNDACGTLTMTHTGQKGATQPPGSNISDSDCWNR